jgi:hypothetical protein
VGEWLQVPIAIGMFILRLSVLFGVILAVGYWLRRLDAKWQAEAKARRREASSARENIFLSFWQRIKG